MIVKTFFYYNDNRDVSKGRRIVETRLLIKYHGTWNAATYLWNTEQTEAKLLDTGMNTTVNWIDQSSSPRVISYHIPGRKECATCHNTNTSLTPIGPKIRNLNMEVQRNGARVNQLTHLQNLGILASSDPHAYGIVTPWTDTNTPVESRARAYMDINCAHCHKSGGKAADTHLLLDYNVPFDQSGIANKKRDIIRNMEEGKMPWLGTTIVDQEGLALIKAYVDGSL